MGTLFADQRRSVGHTWSSLALDRPLPRPGLTWSGPSGLRLPGAPFPAPRRSRPLPIPVYVALAEVKEREASARLV